MNTSIFLAQVLGLYLLIVGIAMLVNAKKMKAVVTEFLNSPALMFFGGVITLILGIILILIHNIWALDWRLIITLLAWLTFIKGFVNLVFPVQDLKFSKQVMHSLNDPIRFRVISAVYVLLGLILCFVGF